MDGRVERVDGGGGNSRVDRVDGGGLNSRVDRVERVEFGEGEVSG